MFSPKSYTVRSVPASIIFNANNNVFEDDQKYKILQQDNMMFRQIRLVTGDCGDYNKYIIFVDCNGSKSKKEEIKNIVINGFYFNGIRFSMSERSASMTRNSILGFIDSSVIAGVNSAVTMGLDIKNTVLSKWCAYRGLMFSSCHCLEGYYPKTIVVPDYEKMIEGQKIKYLVDDIREYDDKDTGEHKIWKTHTIEEGVRDIPLNVFDGSGMVHPSIAKEMQEIIGCESQMTSIQIRAPFIKGLIHSVNYTEYLHDCGIEYIEDIWGEKHSVDDEMIILTAGMYKGLKYFKLTGTTSDWHNYWDKFKEYNHCWGIAKWNFTKEEEPVYTRANYQILQDLDLPFEDFIKLSYKSLDWAEKIVKGDSINTYCFLGLVGDKPKPLNNYARAILKNPEMIKEDGVRSFIKKQTKKYIDKMKAGKIYIRACYKFWIPDMIMMLEWIGGNKNPQGCLKDGEFWSDGEAGERLIERNPHICRSEHLILSGVTNELIEKYCGNLVNTCMVNSYGLSCARLNGAD